jgi:tetratricopeptide (TPR) repeat protein
MRALLSSCFTALLVLAPFAGRADEKGSDADALFDEARALMVHGDYAEACPKLERSDALDPGIGTELNLARCYDLAGTPARASAMYQRVIDATVVAGQTERENAARRLQGALAPRIAYATFDSAPEAARLPGLEVHCDGVIVDLSARGGATPIDPGVHVIEAAAPGRLSWRAQITIRREGERVVVAIPLLDALPSDGAAEPAASPSSVRPAVDPDSRRAAPSASLHRPMAAVALGAAVVAAGIGVYFGAEKLSLASEARDHCGTAGCDPEGISASRDSIPVGNAATGAFIASGALLAASAILWFTAPRSAPARILLLAPAMSASGGGLVMMGHW